MSGAPKVGDRIPTWFSGESDGLSTIIEVRPYVGRYTELFRFIVRATAPRSMRGWMEVLA